MPRRSSDIHMEGGLGYSGTCIELVAEAGDSSGTQREGIIGRWKPLTSNG
jgi:hypothetical protein